MEAKVDLGSVRTSISISSAVSLVNTGNLTQQITFQPTVVTVHAAITSQTTETRLAIDATVTGQVAPGYMLTGLQTTPLTVLATGPAGVLAGLTALDTQPVNVNGLSKDTTMQVALLTPSGVSSSVTVVTVVVSISPVPSATPTPTPAP
ncbi:YbbR family protein, partial [mine drainage metagenome]